MSSKDVPSFICYPVICPRRGAEAISRRLRCSGSFGAAARKGLDFNLRRNRPWQLSPRRGWGARLRPAHCHPDLDRPGSDGALPGSTRSLPRVPSALSIPLFMNVFELTRALVDIESITENEERVRLR